MGKLVRRSAVGQWTEKIIPAIFNVRISLSLMASVNVRTEILPSAKLRAALGPPLTNQLATGRTVPPSFTPTYTYILLITSVTKNLIQAMYLL